MYCKVDSRFSFEPGWLLPFQGSAPEVVLRTTRKRIFLGNKCDGLTSKCCRGSHMGSDDRRLCFYFLVVTYPAYLPEVTVIVVFVSVILSPESLSLSVRSVVREGW